MPFCYLSVATCFPLLGVAYKCYTRFSSLHHVIGLLVNPRRYDGNQPPPSLGSAWLLTLLSIAPTTRLLSLPTYNPAQTSVFGSSLHLFYKLTLVDAGVKQVSLLSHTPTPVSFFEGRSFLSFQVA